jgi:hypothetical protein
MHHTYTLSEHRIALDTLLLAGPHDLESRLANRVQLTSDGHRPYLYAVEAAFADQVDYSMLVKIYGADPQAEIRYSPAKCIGAVKQQNRFARS